MASSRCCLVNRLGRGADFGVDPKLCESGGPLDSSSESTIPCILAKNISRTLDLDLFPLLSVSVELRPVADCSI